MSKSFHAFIRPELKRLKPYSSARDDFKGNADIFLDANENPFGSLYNRYPDPNQSKLKQRISEIKHIDQNSIFLGNGSDEVLDLIMRLFCIPGKDKIIITPPTYGMYKVLAEINNLEIIESLLLDNFQLNVDEILSHSGSSKVLFLCNPNNPSGSVLDENDLRMILDSYEGIVVVDEAYVDFAKDKSLLSHIPKYSRLIVTQTLSKAWGMAGIRVGMAFANAELIDELKKIKPPYNINSVSQQIALNSLNDIQNFKDNIDMLLSERKRLIKQLKGLKMVQHIYPSHANFLLVEFSDASHYYKELIKRGIVVRDRSRQYRCENCLRITVGTPEENTKLIRVLTEMKS